jgi:hypothetical protein
MVDGESFTVTAGINDNGFYPSIDLDESGTLFYVKAKNDNNLITADYDAYNNTLNFTSQIFENGDIRFAGSASISDFIFFDDDVKILSAKVDLADGREAIMIEGRGFACTYADGISAQIYLVEIKPDGDLELICSTRTEGSGFPEDGLTDNIRDDFNDASGINVSKDCFDDMFFEGNMYIEQENLPQLAVVAYQSDSFHDAEKDDWDSAREKYEELMSLNYGETTRWGDGVFISYTH